MVEHKAYVRYQYFTDLHPGGIGPIFTDTIIHVLDYIIDIAIFKVNLTTGALTTSVHPVEEYSAVPKRAVGSLGTYLMVGDGSRSRYPSSVAIHAALSEDHPFKSCGSALWSRNNTSEVSSFQSYADRLLKDIFLDGAHDLDFYYYQTQPSMFNLLGLNTIASRRLVSKALFVGGLDEVYELSSYQPGNGGTCATYRDIAEIWTDSYSNYRPENVLDREDVFADLDGLTAADQDLFLSTTYQPPGSIAPGTSTAGSTSAASYFMETDATSLLSFVDNQSVAVRYWIPD